MGEQSIINDPNISDLKLITPKPILLRLDVFPFLIAYACAFTIYYFSTEEWISLIGMILFPVIIFIQCVVALVGYWSIPLRLKIAYYELDYTKVMTSFKQFSPFVFRQGIEAAEAEYSSALRTYQFYYTIYSQTLTQLYERHKQAVLKYNPNNPNEIPPGDFVPPSAPTIPQRGLPIVYYNDQPLSVCVLPEKQYGSPLITTLTFDSSLKDRVGYEVIGGASVESVHRKENVYATPTITIHSDGPSSKYPPITFSYHHAKYICDPAMLDVKPSGNDHDDIPTLTNPLVFQHITFPDNLSFATYFQTPPLSVSSISYMLGYYGRNSLSVPIPSYISLFIENAMSPFFIFQIICILLWCLDEYWYYSLFTLVMIVGLELVVVYKRRSQLTMMLGEKPELPLIYAYRTQSSSSSPSSSESGKSNEKGKWQLVSTQDLVPNDVVCLAVYNDHEAIDKVYGSRSGNDDHTVSPTDAAIMANATRPQLYTLDIPCDMVLLNGGCVCDEAMLTGESVPQIKEDLLSLITEAPSAVSTTTTTTTTTTSSSANDASTMPSPSSNDMVSTTLSPTSHKRHHLYGGTKVIGIQRPLQLPLDNDMVAAYQSDWPILSIPPPPLPAHTDAVLCRVLRTNFATTQGSLVRTILTASGQKLIDKEALLFILCLLCCAIVSAYYVLVEGLSDPDRSRYKLLLNVITILTSVVPPELPMELSMAVNNALQSLAKSQVFCTDPNRIPNAGSVNVCCFDKTGTLTSDTFLLTNAIVADYVDGNPRDSDGIDDTNDDHDDDKSSNTNVRFVHVNLDDVEQGSSQDAESSPSPSEKQLDCSSFPIDVRLILGTAHELTMLQVKKGNPHNNAATAKKNDMNIRIVGNPMESVALSSSGFTFNTQQDRAKYGSLYCEAVPIELKPSSTSTPTSSPSTTTTTTTSSIFKPSTTLKEKIRIDADVLHRFAFSSSLQRMSSVIAISPAKNAPKPSTAQSTDASSSSSSSIWLNSTLPSPSLRKLASQTHARVVMKGSPECIYSMLHPDYRPPYDEYTKAHKALARKGVRVLAMAWKPMFIDNQNVLVDLPGLSSSSSSSTSSGRGVNEKTSRKSIKIPSRESCEQGMFFAGIIGFTSPLKTQSLDVITHLHESNHRTVMITGDHLLTAIAIAKELRMTSQTCWILRPVDDAIDQHDETPESLEFVEQVKPSSSNSNLPSDKAFVWMNEYEEVVRPFTVDDPFILSAASTTAAALGSEYDSQSTTHRSDHANTMPGLCISGDVFTKIHQYFTAEQLAPIISQCSIFARTLPHQKEMILKYLSLTGNHTVMCGDGTNDVGALTHADIGIALLSADTDNVEVKTAAQEKLDKMNKHPRIASLLKSAQKLRETGFISQAENAEKTAHMLYKKIQSASNTLGMDMDDDEEEDAVAKLGDASLAASFTAKHGSIRCVVDVIRQGRCALSTTGQMYQILALQCLVAAYSLAALYFQGVRQSESQMTVGGMVSAAMFMLLARAQPLDRISKYKPNSRIFSFYNITTILLQFVIHLGILMYLVNESLLYTSSDFLKEAKVEGANYVPSVLNSTVFILSTSMTAATILANYVGYPFMTPMTTTTLFKILIGVIIFCVVLSLEYMPEINEALEMAPMPNDDFTLKLSLGVIIDAVLTFIIAFACRIVFGIVPLSVLIRGDPKDAIPVISSSQTTTKKTTETKSQDQSSAPTAAIGYTETRKNK